jgi:TolA-binding protein
MHMRQKFFVLATVAALLPLAQARAQSMIQSQEGIALQNEIDQLQSQMQQLQANGGSNGGSALGGSSSPAPSNSGGGAPDQGMVANLVTQVQQLQQQVQDLSGKVDELQNQVNTQHDATEKEIGDLKFQVGGSGGAAPGGAPQAGAGPQSLAAPAQSAPAPETPAPEASAAPTDPHAALKAALAAYSKHDYATAQSLAQGILTQNKEAPEAYRAQYLVAQSLTAQGKAQDAAIAYDSTYNMNRSGTYAPQSLLGLASSLSSIGQNEAACDTISSLNSQFPTPPAGMQPRIDSVSKRAHCQ